MRICICNVGRIADSHAQGLLVGQWESSELADRKLHVSWLTGSGALPLNCAAFLLRSVMLALVIVGHFFIESPWLKEWSSETQSLGAGITSQDV